MEGLEEIRWVKLKTPFGDPSDAYCTGRFQGRRMIFLPRHGRGHRLTPSELNYRANIYGMKALGAHALVSISAVGSMKEEIHPLELVVPDQFYDNTRRRAGSFFGDGIVAHVGMAHPVCAGVAAALAKAGKEVLRRVIPLIPESCGHGCPEALRSAVITDPGAFPPRARKKLALLLDRHFPAKAGARPRG